MMNYRVRWRSKKTGATGHGSPISQRDAELHADQANRELPNIEHWIEPCEVKS